MGWKKWTGGGLGPRSIGQGTGMPRAGCPRGTYQGKESFHEAFVVDGMRRFFGPVRVPEHQQHNADEAWRQCSAVVGPSSQPDTDQHLDRRFVREYLPSPEQYHPHVRELSSGGLIW